MEALGVVLVRVDQARLVSTLYECATPFVAFVELLDVGAHQASHSGRKRR
jgi:hypothetical protein